MKGKKKTKSSYYNFHIECKLISARTLKYGVNVQDLNKSHVYFCDPLVVLSLQTGSMWTSTDKIKEMHFRL